MGNCGFSNLLPTFYSYHPLTVDTPFLYHWLYSHCHFFLIETQISFEVYLLLR